VPELPDITIYLEALERRILKHPLERIRVGSPFVLRSVDPPLVGFEGRRVTALRRIGKRIAIGFQGELWLVLHLMIAGRLHWAKPKAKLPGKRGLAAFDFDNGTLILTEAGSRRRASLHTAAGADALGALDPSGLEVLDSTLDQFHSVLISENHTLKRALTDPHLFSGIGNAYSDEILHHARLSPVALTRKLSEEEIRRLHRACIDTLVYWTDQLRAEAGSDFPEGVTAFREGMAAHGRYGLPCPDCGTKIQRIRYADNETNYCPVCQTGGKLLADRSLSRLLKSDWPRSIEELEARIEKAPEGSGA
jgi:formamidopyrimidine-DNA glycosylase